MTSLQTESKSVIAIIAGGKSSRMGVDKTKLLWRGKTLLQNVAEQALLSNLPVVVVGQDRPENWPHETIQFVEDIVPDIGPIGGLATAFSQAPSSTVIALASDMPLIDLASINWLIKQAQSAAHNDGLITVSANGLEPLFSVYAPSCATLVSNCIDSGIRSLQKLIARGDFQFVDIPSEIEPKLSNVNTPTDWARITSSI